MPDTHELAVVPAVEERPPPRRGAVFVTLSLTVVMGLVAAFVIVVGFWPQPAGPAPARSPEAARQSATLSGGAEDTGLPGGRTTLDPTVPTDTEAAVLGNWPFIFGDEFDGPTLDPTDWQPYEGETRGGASRRLPENLTVSDGTLKVTSRGIDSAGMSWQPGQTYGRWEVRARLQAGAGYRPALLLWPDAEDWPLGGEIDFLDVPDPDRAESHFVVHYGGDNSQDGVTTVADFTQWHNYAVEWAPDHISGFIDGQEVFRTEDQQKIPTGAMHLVIQQDVGPSEDGWTPAPDATTPPQVQMEVDWVRIYAP